MRRLLLVLVLSVTFIPFFGVKAIVLTTDGNYCWCRNAGWTCTNHTAEQVVPGGTAGGTITAEQCNSFCAGRPGGSRAIHLDDTYRADTICTSECVRGGSCPDAIPSENACICTAGDVSHLAGGSVTDSTSCCDLCRTGGLYPASVGYGGAEQACPANPGVIGTPTTAGPITLYNPLGAETDIPAFIGRGIRGVLGVVGAIALLMFVYGGVMWMTSAGDQKKVQASQSIIKNSVIGLLLIFFSYNLIGIFFSFFR